MKKVLIIGLIVIILFLGLFFLLDQAAGMVTDKDEYYLYENIGFTVRNFSIYPVSYTDDCGRPPMLGYQKWNGNTWESEPNVDLFTCLKIIRNIDPFQIKHFWLGVDRIKEPGTYRIDFLWVSNEFLVKDVVEPFEFLPNTKENLDNDKKTLQNFENLIKSLDNYFKDNHNYPERAADLSENATYFYRYKVSDDKQAFCISGTLKSKTYGPKMAEDEGTDTYLYEKGKFCNPKNYVSSVYKYCPIDMDEDFLGSIGKAGIDGLIVDVKPRGGVENMTIMDVCKPDDEYPDKCKPIITMELKYPNYVTYGKTDAIKEIGEKFEYMVYELNKRKEFAETAIVYHNSNTSSYGSTFVLKDEYAISSEAAKIKDIIGTYFYGLMGEMENKYSLGFGQSLSTHLYNYIPPVRVVFKVPGSEDTLTYLKEKWKLDLSKNIDKCIKPSKKSNEKLYPAGGIDYGFRSNQ